MSNSIQLRVKRLHPNAILPKNATAGAACFDLHAIEGGVIGDGLPTAFATGLSFEIPPGYVLQVHSRSGHGFKHGVRLANATGIIDSDYRGEVLVKLVADGGGFLHVRAGDRIAQAMLVPVPAVELIERDELSTTERGTGGFGSTGA